LFDTGDSRDEWFCTGSNEIRLGTHRLAIYEQRGWTGERGCAGKDLESVRGGDVCVLGLAEHADQLVFLLHERGEVNVASNRGDARERIRDRGLAYVSGREERL